MPINNNYSLLSRSIKTINNPSLSVGTLIEEIPADIGRSYAGYKRGGIIEGAEKMRKELMSAIVWMFGIPAFNKLGNLFCENILKIPTTKIDFSNAKKGNNAILDTAKYLTQGIKKDGLDYSDLEKFVNNKKFNFDKITAQDLAKKISTAKKATSILAVVLNCAAMGIIIPKINQHMTQKTLEKQKQKEKETQTTKNFVSFDEFKSSTKKESKPISFKGHIPTNTNDFTYSVENNNRFRLLVTDIPMIIGRMVTSRNKYEALEYLMMDGMSAYFYNFASEHTQKLLRGKSLPNTQAITIETLVNNPETFKIGLEKLQNDPNIFKLKEKQKPDTILKNIFGDEIASEIYKNETYGKYGKANRYVEDSTIKNINNSIENFINYLKKQAAKERTNLIVDDKLNIDFISKAAKKAKTKNAGFLAIGLGVSILGLSIIIPKLTFAITKFLTGKNEFTGIAKYDENEKKKEKVL